MKAGFQVDFDGFWDALPHRMPCFHQDDNVSQYGVLWMFFGFNVLDLHSVKLTLGLSHNRPKLPHFGKFGSSTPDISTHRSFHQEAQPRSEGWSNIQDVGQK